MSDLVKNRDNIIHFCIAHLNGWIVSNLRNYIVCLFYLRMVVCCRRSFQKEQKEARNSRLAGYSYLKDEKRLIGII